MAILAPMIQLDEASWLDHRKTGIGASEILVALGMSKWKSAYTLWAEKSGKLAPEPVTGIAVELGHFLEPFIARKFAEETGRYVTDPGDFTVYTHPDHDFLFCTPDRLQTVPDWGEDDSPLEEKSTGEFAAKDWKDEPPLAARVQLQGQMEILGKAHGSLAGLVGNRALYWHDETRDDELCEKMIARLSEFWERVQNGDPPPVDGSDSTHRTLEALHPDDNGTEVYFPPSVVELTTDIDEAQDRLGLEKQIIDEAKNQIREMLGPATFGEFGTIRYSNKTIQRKDTLKVALEVEQQLIDAGIPYERKAGSKSRTLRRLKVK